LRHRPPALHVKGKPSGHPTSRFKRRAIPSRYGLFASRDQLLGKAPSVPTAE